MSYSVCSGRDVNFHARKLKYAAKEQLSAAQVSCKTLFGEIDKSWNDYAQKVSKNSAWVFFQLFRSNFDLPIPLVNAPFARRVVEISASQAKVANETNSFVRSNKLVAVYQLATVGLFDQICLSAFPDSIAGMDFQIAPSYVSCTGRAF